MRKLVAPILLRYGLLLGAPAALYGGIRWFTEGVDRRGNTLTVTHYDGLSRVTYRTGNGDDVMVIDSPIVASVSMYDNDKDGVVDEVSDSIGTYRRGDPSKVNLFDRVDRDWKKYREEIKAEYPALDIISGGD